MFVRPSALPLRLMEKRTSAASTVWMTFGYPLTLGGTEPSSRAHLYLDIWPE
jgi:hypothetical protein